MDTVPIDADEVAEIDLLGRQQVGQQVYEEALNGALLRRHRTAGQYLPGGGIAAASVTRKRTVGGGIENALLDEAEFDVRTV